MEVSASESSAKFWGQMAGREIPNHSFNTTKISLISARNYGVVQNQNLERWEQFTLSELNFQIQLRRPICKLWSCVQWEQLHFSHLCAGTECWKEQMHMYLWEGADTLMGVVLKLLQRFWQGTLRVQGKQNWTEKMDLNSAVTHDTWCAAVCFSLVIDAVSSHREDMWVYLIVSKALCSS